VVAVSAILAVVVGFFLWPGAYDKLWMTDGQMVDIASLAVFEWGSGSQVPGLS